jgi:hypothetical protein
LAIHLAGQGRARQARADAGGDLGHGDGMIETPFGAIGQTNDRHGNPRKQQKPRLRLLD